MYELWYWCLKTSEWKRVEGPDYHDWGQALRVAERATVDARRAIQVRDLYSGEVLYQTSGIGRPVSANHPVYW